MTQANPVIRQVASLLQRWPWLGVWIQRAMRVWQPRFTAGVVGVLLDDAAGRVFLVEHVYHAHTPWGLPGGWIDRNENPARAIEREFLAETGLRVRAVRPLIIQLGDRWRRHLDMAYLVALEGQAQPVRLCNELLAYRWVPVDDLPLLVSVHRQAIHLARQAVSGVALDAPVM